MSIAVTKGKISRTGNNLGSGSEDLLTASVFGLIRYLPAEVLLFPILERAENIGRNILQIDKNVNDNSIEFDFWPQLKNSEPDLKIDLGNHHTIFIEAKFYSGKSGSNDKDQLFRQYSDLHNLKPGLGTILYLTKHRTMPEAEISDSIDAVRKFGGDLNPIDFKSDTYWLSWFEIWEICKTKKDSDDLFKKRIISDICELLEKLGLKHFTGFSRIKDVDNIDDSKSVIYGK